MKIDGDKLAEILTKNAKEFRFSPGLCEVEQYIGKLPGGAQIFVGVRSKSEVHDRDDEDLKIFDCLVKPD
jgi:hypothetical protein